MPRLKEPFGQRKYARYAPTIYRCFPFLGYLWRMALYLLVELIWSTVFQMKNVKWRKAIEKSTLEQMHGTYHHDAYVQPPSSKRTFAKRRLHL